MAEAITYADLRFVKAPLKNIGCRLGQDENEDEDGELTYENVSPAQGGLSKLASSGPGDKAGLSSEDQHPSPWPSATLPAAKRVLPTCVHYVLLGLLLGCLFLAVAAICLMVRYLQVLQQLQGVHGVLESTNSSLRQELRETSAKLEQTKMELKGSKDELEQSKSFLEKEQQVGQDTEKQLKDCQRDLDNVNATLQQEETQRKNLEQRLENVQDRLRRLYTCTSPDSCCPLGWELNKRTCFHVLLARRSWEDCIEYCKLSSNLIIADIYYYSDDTNINYLYPMLYQLSWSKLYMIRFRNRNDGKTIGYNSKRTCVIWEKHEYKLSYTCSGNLPCICESPAFRNEELELPLNWDRSKSTLFCLESVQLGQGPIQAPHFSAACCPWCEVLFPGKGVKKPRKRDSGLPEWNGVGEGAWAELIGAARSQPGSFIEIFLNNLHVSLLCQQHCVCLVILGRASSEAKRHVHSLESMLRSPTWGRIISEPKGAAAVQHVCPVLGAS
ncbi:B-cell differentiation antigen CD72 [Suncus etruscus]|uniref:B-cell differentiation antigen CD72 n=1 Tax=Suncus etruscus TaxID=109475 RepID=UPI00210F432A|nr:B-cell differentiation antigen CD72 [Suncus etruscus]